MDHVPFNFDAEDGKVFRSIFTAYPDALLLVNAKGTIVLANPFAVDLLGYSGDALIGLPVEALVPDAVRPRHAAYRHAYGEQPRSRPMGTQMDLVARRRDGSEVRVEIALSPLHDHGLPYVVAAIRDVGSYPRVRQALQRARYAEHLAHFGRLAVDARDTQALLAQVPAMAAEALEADAAMVLLLEPDGLTFRIAAGTGLTADKCAGQAVPVEVVELATRVVATGGTARAGPCSGADTGHLLAVPLSDRGRTIGALAVRCASLQHLGDDELRFLDSLASLLATLLQREKSEEALNHAQRLETVGQLTGGIAHDFNNLLTVISGNLQVLEELPGYAEEPMVQQLLGAATRAARRGAELTGKLLAFSRRQVLQPTVIDAAALLHSLGDMLRRTLDQRIAIALDADEALCLADPVQLESALLNIAINARDAMPQGGTLAFTCRSVPALPPELRAEATGPSASGYVAITVADTGTGMSEAVQEHAFEPFFTTKEVGRGTGLGLSTVYGFAKQSRGAIGLRSTLGVGTAITLYLPQLGDGDDIDNPETDAGGRLPTGLRVLLVEDDAEVRQVAQQFLLTMSCAVTSCATAEAALEVLDTDTAFDLLLSDISLGLGLRGTELAQRVEQRLPQLPVLLMSGFSQELAGASSGRELLQKPYTREALERAMVRVLHTAR
ncbi:PAS domain S-box protein [Variovorax arabinosiphilus]|uniref:PAS domain S-box protein n=1 Tax=Variovorax arabinosiphilus TaxID=3053498 RepID=UPI002579132B|nr:MULTISPECIES: PAS domain S-box protein [unclassified Variovorax]MDM0118310.1 PAS domain S-box protein [Variovorax sp. J2L1-78]MDM0128735.1 PAS domain S-box protein [Variovorax sp. J2L1-63]MDM0233479.1 PAS domain S-box protein [Variovorax sp. J2R1-6]